MLFFICQTAHIFLTGAPVNRVSYRKLHLKNQENPRKTLVGELIL